MTNDEAVEILERIARGGGKIWVIKLNVKSIMHVLSHV